MLLFIEGHGSVSDILQCINFEAKEEYLNESQVGGPDVNSGIWVAVTCYICRCNVQLPLEMGAREEYKGPRLLRKQSACED